MEPVSAEARHRYDGGMDRHQQLRSFVLVAEKGGFAAAALVEGVTPVVMGRRLSALEERLGVKLMHRSTRGLRLTDMGAEFLERCRAMLRDFDELEESLSRGRRSVSGDLVVSAPAGFGRRHVAAHAPAFIARHPGIRLSLQLTDAFSDLVRDRVDLAVRIGPVTDTNVVVVKLHPNRRVVCGSPAYFARAGLPRTPEDLAGHNCLTLSAAGGQTRGWTFKRDDRVSTIRVRGTLACSDGELLTDWMRQGLGLGWRSTWEVQPALARGELLSVLDEYALPDYDIQALYPEQRYVSAKVQAFIEFLKEIYARPGYWDGAPTSVARSTGRSRAKATPG
jgi:DNA-binding transcriptional LysR family regulator